MGLNIPLDLHAWQRWQQKQRPLRRLRDAVRGSAPITLHLHVRGIEPAVLFALDATTPTALASVLGPLAHLGDAPVAVLAPRDVASRLPGEWTVHALESVSAVPAKLRGVRAAVSAGHFLAAGFVVHLWAEALRAEYFVVQHGLLTPFMAPLAPRAHLLAFSDEDAEFWRSDRRDVTAHVIGSQLLWTAATRGREVSSAAAGKQPVFLGQLHGAELPRSISAATAQRFCLQTGAEYRPHPAELDRLSKLQHSIWQRRGIRIAKPGGLLDERRPVVSIFSTGVLEAAAAGVPSWVTCERPPTWVREFWDRYELSTWGEQPTPPPALPEVEPAQAIAQHVAIAVEGGR